MEDFVTYEQAIKLKELGFVWKCFGYYLYDDDEVRFGETPKEYNYIVGNDHISAPTLAQVQKWLREVKGISVEPVSCWYEDNVSDNMVWSSFICSLKDKSGFVQTADFNTYEETLSAGIDKVIQFLVQQNN